MDFYQLVEQQPQQWQEQEWKMKIFTYLLSNNPAQNLESLKQPEKLLWKGTTQVQLKLLYNHKKIETK